MSRSKLKSLYVTIYIGLLMIAGIHSLVAFVSSGFAVAWVGAMLAILPMLAFFGWLVLAQVPRTSPNLSYHLLLGLIGTLISSMGVIVEGYQTILPLVYAGGIGLTGTLIYVYWYSRFDRHRSALIEVGKSLPKFELENAQGESVHSRAYLGQYTIFLFFRGNWCPLCMAQIREIAKEYQLLAELGVRVALVSGQPHANTESLARKTGVAFDYLVDREYRAAKILGIFQVGGLPMGMQLLGYDSDTTLPTVIITDPDGHIILSDQTDNYRVRPEPDLFQQVVESHQKTGQVALNKFY